MKNLTWVVCILALSACVANPTTIPTLTPVLSPSQTVYPLTPGPALLDTPTLTLPVNHTATATLPATGTFTSTATAVTFQVCSPLQDISLPELSSILTTPFNAPTPGQDNGHQGVDFAYYHHGSHTVMLGLPVYSVLRGKVAAVINDRPPYGNAIIIETPLTGLPAGFLDGLGLRFQPTPPAIDGRLTCPTPASSPAWLPDPSSPSPSLPDHYSLYLLYAHLEDTPTLAAGDGVTCGQTIGAVGNTGNSGNPHLHLETRFGPSGATFTSLSHYNNQATAEEMSNYCTWRVSGVFQSFDPMTFLKLAQNYP